MRKFFGRPAIVSCRRSFREAECHPIDPRSAIWLRMTRLGGAVTFRRCRVKILLNSRFCDSELDLDLATQGSNHQSLLT